MTQAKAAAKTRRAKNAPTPALTAETPIAPSLPVPVTLSRLRRAPENVRHIRIDEEVESLVALITAHGFTSSLIGYESSWPDDADRVFVVGGGRRLQALELLRDRGQLTPDFIVPVLIRDAEQAVELSLMENLGQKTMSPVDEFRAFKALIDTGHHSPAELAKRFGFTETKVKQRLRLAELAEPVLDALAERQITLDAAYAYATTQDKDRQVEVFKRHAKAAQSWSHQAHHIRNDVTVKSISTANPLFKFVGAESYERRGGRYEDDLFREGGTDRMLRDAGVLERAAEEMIAFQSTKLVAELRKSEEAWAATISGTVTVTDLRLTAHGPQYDKRPAPPAGHVMVDRWDHAPMWRTIRNNGIDVRVLVGIDPDGELIAWPRVVYVEESQKEAIDPSRASANARPAISPEDAAASERKEAISRFAYRLAVPAFVGTHFEGRAFWPSEGWRDRPEKAAREGIPGWYVPVRIFVTDGEVEAAFLNAEKAYEEDLVEKARAAEATKQGAAEAEAASERRAAELAAMSPPAVAVIDGDVWLRAQDNSYAPVYDDGAYVEDWTQLLDHYDETAVDATYDTREAFDQAMANASAPLTAEAAE